MTDPEKATVTPAYLLELRERLTASKGVPYSAPIAYTSQVYLPDGWRWLESTRRLQEESFGVDCGAMTPEELADYITYNHSALSVELGEFMAEVGWKPWANPRGWVNREQAVKELVDVGHFLANLCCALKVTDDEWEQRYREKQAVNRERQAKGYDGRSEKCNCGRAHEDGQWIDSMQGWRCVCGRFNSR